MSDDAPERVPSTRRFARAPRPTNPLLGATTAPPRRDQSHEEEGDAAPAPAPAPAGAPDPARTPAPVDAGSSVPVGSSSARDLRPASGAADGTVRATPTPPRPVVDDDALTVAASEVEPVRTMSKVKPGYQVAYATDLRVRTLAQDMSAVPGLSKNALVEAALLLGLSQLERHAGDVHGMRMAVRDAQDLARPATTEEMQLLTDKERQRLSQ